MAEADDQISVEVHPGGATLYVQRHLSMGRVVEALERLRSIDASVRIVRVSYPAARRAAAQDTALSGPS